MDSDERAHDGNRSWPRRLRRRLAKQVVWFAGDPALRGTVTAGVRDLASLLIAASVIAWLATWVALFGPRRSLVVAQRIQISAMAALAASGLILTANSVTGVDGWLVGASIVNLASGLAGLILARRVAVIVIATMVTVDAVLVSVVVVAGEADQAWSLAMVYPLYALTLGLACTAARNGLVRSAMERDDSAAELSASNTAHGQRANLPTHRLPLRKPGFTKRSSTP